MIKTLEKHKLFPLINESLLKLLPITEDGERHIFFDDDDILSNADKFYSKK